MKRILAVADLHCGHVAGLTPSRWHVGDRDERLNELQQSCWTWFEKNVKANGPYDVLIANADLIDGRNAKQGGVELLTTDRREQVKMAAECLDLACNKGTKVVLTYGTGVHVSGDGEDWEAILADNFSNCEKIGSHEWVECEHVTIDIKHHIGSSVIPHGRHTAIARDRLWNLLWAERGEQPKANVILRAHCHYHNFCGGPGWLAMTQPALQAPHTRYGARRCSGIVDFGVTIIECSKGQFSWKCLLASFKGLLSRPVIV